MKCASQVQQGNTPPLSLSFLSRKPELCRVTRGEEFLDPQVQRKLFEDRTSRCVILQFRNVLKCVEMFVSLYPDINGLTKSGLFQINL